MNINHDKSYLNLWHEEKEVGITEEKIHRIRFLITKDEEAAKAINKIADWLEENFIMYQRNKKDNYKTHQLFYWSDGSNNYFTIDYNDLYSFDEWDQWTEKITKYIEENYVNIVGNVYLQYKNCIKWNEVNNYIINTDFDINNLPYRKLKVISNYAFTSGSRLAEESKDKIAEIDLRFRKEFLKSKENSKVVFNGYRGTMRKVYEGEYGFFKPRAKKNYYKIRLSSIDSLEFLAF